jgi:hypothetical protein
MPPKGDHANRIASTYGQFQFSASSVHVFFIKKSGNNKKETNLATHGNRHPGGATKRSLWTDIVDQWIRKLKTHQIQRKVGALRPPPPLLSP